MKTEQKIDCAFDELIDIQEVEKRKNAKNPNTHPESQIELLCKIIAYQGCRSPIVLSKRSGLIVKGHARLEAMKRLDWKKVPVDWQDYESEDQEIADMVADNELQKMSLLDFDVLQNALADFDLLNEDMSQYLALPSSVINFLADQINSGADEQILNNNSVPVRNKTRYANERTATSDTGEIEPSGQKNDYFNYYTITIIFTDKELYEKTKALKSRVESNFGPESAGHALFQALDKMLS